MTDFLSTLALGFLSFFEGYIVPFAHFGRGLRREKKLGLQWEKKLEGKGQVVWKVCKYFFWVIFVEDICLIVLLLVVET